MTQSPISADLQNAYRSVLSTQNAPTTFDTDTPLTPVVVIGSASVASGASFTKVTDGTDTLLINTDGSALVTSLPTPRTGQTLINKSSTKTAISITSGTGINLYTVTAGKTFYLQTITFSANNATTFDVRDSASVAGTPIVAAQVATAISSVITYPSPVKFSTGVWLDVGSTITNGATWSISGWEE